jgi:hypothetical protein
MKQASEFFSYFEREIFDELYENNIFRLRNNKITRYLWKPTEMSSRHKIWKTLIDKL